MTLTLLLETLTSGQVAASILEFPHWRVEAETREAAISQLQATFLKRLKYIETVAWDVSLPTSEPSWMPFAGTFSNCCNDPDFAAIMDAIRHERDIVKIDQLTTSRTSAHLERETIAWSNYL